MTNIFGFFALSLFVPLAQWYSWWESNPTTPWLKVKCSANWATTVYLLLKVKKYMATVSRLALVLGFLSTCSRGTGGSLLSWLITPLLTSTYGHILVPPSWIEQLTRGFSVPCSTYWATVANIALFVFSRWARAAPANHLGQMTGFMVFLSALKSDFRWQWFPFFISTYWPCDTGREIADKWDLWLTRWGSNPQPFG